MQELLCKLGIHSYKTINCTDCFTTTFTDKPNWPPIKHMVWYQICSCCGKRHVKDTVKKDSLYSNRHNGVEYAKIGWITYGRMYLGEGKEVTFNPPAPKPKKPKLTVVDGGKNG